MNPCNQVQLVSPPGGPSSGFNLIKIMPCSQLFLTVSAGAAIMIMPRLISITFMPITGLPSGTELHTRITNTNGLHKTLPSVFLRPARETTANPVSTWAINILLPIPVAAITGYRWLPAFTASTTFLMKAG